MVFDVNVTIDCSTREQAEKVIVERIGYDEDHGFEYTIDWNNLTDGMLSPGNYSVFVLIDDQTWQQPVFKIEEPMHESRFKQLAEAACGGFIAYGVDRDDEADEENIRTFA